MGNVQSCVLGSLCLCSVYLLYGHIYCSYCLLKTNELKGDRLPSLAYLYIKYLTKALCRTPGTIYSTNKSEVIYTVLNCRLDHHLLRSFCTAAGYGWDYPDSEYRDIPLCFPETLFVKPLLMLLTDGNFRLSPTGLVRVRQTLKTLQPVDELTKGPFTLQVRILNYRHVDAGVEVDICLSASSRCSNLVWESVLTLMSKNKLKASRCSSICEHKDVPDETDDVTQVELRVPRVTCMQNALSSSEYSPFQLFSLPARLFGYRSKMPPTLWMLSVCFAEIEKHKGVKVITAPVSVTVQFTEPVLASGKLDVRFWDRSEPGNPSSAQGLSFHMQQHGGNKRHVVGLISRPYNL